MCLDQLTHAAFMGSSPFLFLLVNWTPATLLLATGPIRCGKPITDMSNLFSLFYALDTWSEKVAWLVVFFFYVSNLARIVLWRLSFFHSLLGHSSSGKYYLEGPQRRRCVGGRLDGEEPRCFGLNQLQDFDSEAAPTILFRHQNGQIAQTNEGDLLITPGTILHMECLWKRRNGTPYWTIMTNSGRTYPQVIAIGYSIQPLNRVTFVAHVKWNYLHF